MTSTMNPVQELSLPTTVKLIAKFIADERFIQYIQTFGGDAKTINGLLNSLKLNVELEKAKITTQNVVINELIEKAQQEKPTQEPTKPATVTLPIQPKEETPNQPTPTPAPAPATTTPPPAPSKPTQAPPKVFDSFDAVMADIDREDMDELMTNMAVFIGKTVDKKLQKIREVVIEQTKK